MEKRDETMKSLPEQVMSYAEERPILVAALLSPGPWGGETSPVALGPLRAQRKRPAHRSGCGTEPTGSTGAARERLAVGAGQIRG